MLVDYIFLAWMSKYVIKKKNGITMQIMRGLYGVAFDANPFGLIIILADLKACLSFVG